MTIFFKIPKQLFVRKKHDDDANANTNNCNDNNDNNRSKSKMSERAAKDKSKRSMKDYQLLVTAGPSRDVSTHVPVPVNSEEALHFDTGDVSCDVYVRVRGYRGPSSTSAANVVGEKLDVGRSELEKLDEARELSPYFEHPLHSKDQYSICFSPLVFKEGGVSGDDLVLGNDFDRSISQALPPGFGVAWRVARYLVDPGLDGDPWAEKPWLEGPVLSSVNALSYGEQHNPHVHEGAAAVVEESLGADLNSTFTSTPAAAADNEAGNNNNNNLLDIPSSSGDRMKYFLKKENRESFEFEKGGEYHMDFFNPYLDFNEFALRLPGVTIRILKYWDGQPLRYVLKNRRDQKVYMVVQFTLVERKEEQEEGSSEGSSYDDKDHIDEETVKVHGGGGDEGAGKAEKEKAAQETSPDDVD